MTKSTVRQPLEYYRINCIRLINDRKSQRSMKNKRIQDRNKNISEEKQDKHRRAKGRNKPRKQQ
jgi:hypothetical protein